MWKKEDGPTDRSDARSESPPMPDRPRRSGVAAETATIGRSIAIDGDVTGDEDLLIQGRVDGSVVLKEHAVTVGPDGEVKASIEARVVTVEGRVEGDLSAEEQVILRGSAWVRGDISAPRVVLEDGAQFQGGVDMGDAPGGKKREGAGVGATPGSRASDSKSGSGRSSAKDDIPDESKSTPEPTIKTGT